MSFGVALALMFMAMLLLVICSSCILLHSRRTTQKSDEGKFAASAQSLAPALVSLHAMHSISSLAHCNSYQSQCSLNGARLHSNNVPIKSTLSSLPAQGLNRPPDVVETRKAAARADSHLEMSLNVKQDSAGYYYTEMRDTGGPPLPARKCPTIVNENHAKNIRSLRFESNGDRDLNMREMDYNLKKGPSNGIRKIQKTLHRDKEAIDIAESDTYSDYNAAYCSVAGEDHYIYQKVW